MWPPATTSSRRTCLICTPDPDRSDRVSPAPFIAVAGLAAAVFAFLLITTCIRRRRAMKFDRDVAAAAAAAAAESHAVQPFDDDDDDVFTGASRPQGGGYGYAPGKVRFRFICPCRNVLNFRSSRPPAARARPIYICCRRRHRWTQWIRPRSATDAPATNGRTACISHCSAVPCSAVRPALQWWSLWTTGRATGSI